MALIRLDPWQTIRKIECKKKSGGGGPTPKTVHPRRKSYTGVSQVFEFAWAGPGPDRKDGPFSISDQPPGDPLTFQAPFVDEWTDLYFFGIVYAPTVGFDNGILGYPIGAIKVEIQVAGASCTATCDNNVHSPGTLGPVPIESGQTLTFTGQATILDQHKNYGGEGVSWYNLAPVALIIFPTNYDFPP